MKHFIITFFLCSAVNAIWMSQMPQENVRWDLWLLATSLVIPLAYIIRYSVLLNKIRKEKRNA